jgi:hypothetical protein
MATNDAAARAARERKQKIFVVLGGIVLLGLLAFQLPKILGGSGSAAAPPSAETTGGESELGTPGTTATPVALVDTDRPLVLGPGHFRSFSQFELKDPFVQQITERKTTETVSRPAPTRSASRPRTRPKAPSRSFSVGGAAAGATILSVNGIRHVLEPGGVFPASDPVFALVSEQPGAKTVVVGLRGGKYSNGDRRLTLRVGKQVVIENSTTRARYRLTLVKAGDGKARSSTGKG